ncbi:hypothetical protein Nmel_006480 [Mimus melanotis]
MISPHETPTSSQCSRMKSWSPQEFRGKVTLDEVSLQFS